MIISLSLSIQIFCLLVLICNFKKTIADNAIPIHDNQKAIIDNSNSVEIHLGDYHLFFNSRTTMALNTIASSANPIHETHKSCNMGLGAGIFDYQVMLSNDEFNDNSIIDSKIDLESFASSLLILNMPKLSLSAYFSVLEYLDHSESLINFLKSCQTFYKIAFKYIDTHLEPLNISFKLNRKVSTALFYVLPKKILNENLIGLHNRSIELEDLIEILLTIHFKSRNRFIKKALLHLYSFINPNYSPSYASYTPPFIYCTADIDPNGLDFYLFSDWHNWIGCATYRVFNGNIFPYSAEMYFNHGIFKQEDFVQGLFRFKHYANPENVKIYFDRVRKIRNSGLTFSRMISIAINHANVPMIELLIPLVPSSTFNKSSTTFLKSLIFRKRFSEKLFGVCRGNLHEINVAIRACLLMSDFDTLSYIKTNMSFNVKLIRFLCCYCY